MTDEDQILLRNRHSYLEFSNRVPAETREITEKIYIELDEEGNLVGMTIEHANTQANMNEISFQQVKKKAA